MEGDLEDGRPSLLLLVTRSGAPRERDGDEAEESERGGRRRWTASVLTSRLTRDASATTTLTIVVVVTVAIAAREAAPGFI